MNSVLVKGLIAVCALVWGGLLVTMGTVKATRELWAPYSVVCTVAAAVVYAFERWLWRMWPFTLIVGRPDLQGTWKGQIVSEWVNPETSATLPPILTFMSVRQTASTLYLRQFTKESESITLAATVLRDGDDAQTVTAVYRNDPKSSVRHRSEIHFGGFHLRVTGTDTLEGHYWTDRKTRGQLTLQRVSRKPARSLADVQNSPRAETRNKG